MKITGNGDIKNLSKFEVCIIKDLRSMDFDTLDVARICIINLANAARGASHDKGIVNKANAWRDERRNKAKESIKNVSDNVVFLKSRNRKK